MNSRLQWIAFAAALVLLAGCDSNSTEPDTFEITYAPPMEATTFQTEVTNPYFPLPVGASWTYIGTTDEGTERILVEVLEQTRDVAGIAARVVRDRVYLNESLIEDTFDWYAQDAEGNVWYLGEETEDYQDGQVISTAGSWEHGVDGAVAGILMPAAPAAGQAYYQEFYKDEAEDRGRVLATNESVTVPAGSFTGCIETEDTTPLEPDVLEHKYYCANVGTVLELDFEDDVRVELVEFTLP